MTTSYSDKIKSISASSVAQQFPEVAPIADVSKASRPSTESSDSSAKLFDGHDEEQIKLMDEICVVLDWDDKPIGGASKKCCHLMDNINDGLVHRAFSVFMFNDRGELLLQQRAAEKITFANMWTNTCCSHPLAVPSEMGGLDLESRIQGAKNAAVRKLEHELGIDPKAVPADKFHFLTRIHYAAPSSGPWGEHEIDYILFVRGDPELKVVANEVRDTVWVSQQGLKDMMADPKLVFTPWFRLICEQALFPWWDQLDNLPAGDDEIRRWIK
ncbi:NUDIX hydrolase domain-like protein [Yarrowia lipolytica]|jgi:isopentenyl-diphosphate delta-isomerase|uniref:Isopentenyl-diphosphate Delta-isomerase n=1 Tax=Yarrowia lipolytica TaxID=4952 RepID=A0A371CG41_YARLL|nr:Isopentenyl-diphosphate Delta-isomerase [Yarrowia lipolytica]RDW29264.1 NUDIX hydrolase domain-like protein [Yarrowia lipolytica]RDW32912.1 NUDIX hydrolase domain-like protein [Yarrowia lipolytica]RDW42515.1 NUDIX hydrolase domain-like protein [Yarrowia lipolytica]RDW47446.1 NUDIX hydrolase domain-like protein [Yarrowia lipolytica]